MINDSKTEDVYNRHKLMIYRICLVYMKNIADAEDIIQETFVKLMCSNKTFESEEHEKAWLIRTCINLCKNQLKHWWRKRDDIDDYNNLANTNDISASKTDANIDVLKEISNLSVKYKTVIYLYYYEGYTSIEIAKMLKKPNSTIRNQLADARKILKNTLGDDFYEE